MTLSLIVLIESYTALCIAETPGRTAQEVLAPQQGPSVQRRQKQKS